MPKNLFGQSMPATLPRGQAPTTSLRPVARYTDAVPTPKQPFKDFFNKPMTPQRQEMIMQLVQAGMSQAANSGSPMAALLAPLAGGLIGRNVMDRAEKYSAGQKSGAVEELINAMGGSGPAGDMAQYRDAIASVESAGSGDYSAVGPATRTGDRAYGRYQVMGSNVGPWTEKHYGRRLTPEEFLKDPKAQDAVFDGEFGSYIKQYGNPQDAAAVWFSGKPMSGNNRSDGNLRVPQYVKKFNTALQRGGRSGNVNELVRIAADPNTPPEVRAQAEAAISAARKTPTETYRMLTPEEAKERGLPEGQYQIGQNGRIYSIPGTSAATNDRQSNVALKSIEEMIGEMTDYEDMTREQAMWSIAQDPIGRRMMENAGLDPASIPKPAEMPEDAKAKAAQKSQSWWSRLFSGGSQPTPAPSIAAPSVAPNDPLGILNLPPA